MAALLAGRTAAKRFVIDQNHDINITPFVDVMLVLLVVFMVAAPLATTTLKLDLWAGRGGPQWQPPILVQIANGGQVSVGQAPGSLTATSLDRLAGDIGRLTGGSQPGQQVVLVSGSQHTRYGAFVGVLDRLHTAGYERVNISGSVS